MCAFPRRPKGYDEAVKRKCLNPDLGRHLDEFNQFMESHKRDKFTFLDETVQHLVECRPCRQSLTSTGNDVLAAELFWSGHFLKGEQKAARQQLRAELTKPGPFRKKVALMKEIARKYREEPWKTEIACIEKFIKV